MAIILSNARQFQLDEIETFLNDLPESNGIYLWYINDISDGIIYIGESKNIRERLIKEIRDFNNGKWNYHDPQIGENFPHFLAQNLDSQSKSAILEKGKIFIPNQPSSQTAFENMWKPKLDYLKKRIKILTFENRSNIENKKVEAYLIDKVYNKYRQATGKKLAVKRARPNHTQIGHIQGGDRSTWASNVQIDFGNLSIPQDIKNLLL